MGNKELPIYKIDDFNWDKDGIAAGGENDVFVHPLDSDKVLKILNDNSICSEGSAREVFYGMSIAKVLLPQNFPDIHYIAGDNYQNTCLERFNIGILKSSMPEKLNKKNINKRSKQKNSLVNISQEKKDEKTDAVLRVLNKYGISIDAADFNFSDQGVYLDRIHNNIDWNKLKIESQKIPDKLKRRRIMNLISYYQAGTQYDLPWSF